MKIIILTAIAVLLYKLLDNLNIIKGKDFIIKKNKTGYTIVTNNGVTDEMKEIINSEYGINNK